MLAHPYAIGGFSYAGIWAFYGLMQGLRESKSPQNHFFFVKRSLRGLFCNRVFQCVIHHLSNPKMKMLKKRMLRTSLNRQLSMLPVAVDAFEPACWEFGPWLIVFLSIAIAKKGGVSGPWGNCSDKAGGPYAFLTHTLRVPYAKKHILFSKLGATN